LKLDLLFRTKGVDRITREAADQAHSLKRTLGALDLTMLGIGAVIGTGIFASIGTATAGNADRPGAGPAIILSFILTAVACVFSALCYAEFAAMIPLAGSAYTYAYATLGEKERKQLHGLAGNEPGLTEFETVRKRLFCAGEISSCEGLVCSDGNWVCPEGGVQVPVEHPRIDHLVTDLQQVAR
jgi:hypothetical protein